MRHTWLIAILPALVWGAPNLDPHRAPKLPVRFERQPDGSFAGLGFGYHVSVSAQGYMFAGSRAVSVAIEGANPSAHARPEQPLAMKTSYFRPAAWRTNVTTYSRVVFDRVLPGVDVVYHGAGDQFEFDLVLQPGADSKDVVLRYSGHDRVAIDSDGNLLVSAGGQHFLQQLPAVYQRIGGNLRLISGAYSILGPDRVAFRLGPYDRSQPLVIDPVISYLNVPGGAGADAAIAMLRDSQGFLYVAGNARSISLPSTSDAYQAANGGDQDVFVMKLNPSAAPPNDVVSLTYIGGTSTDEVRAMTSDAQGILYLTGFTASSNFPTTSGAAATASKGDRDAFFLKLDFTQSGSGQLVYSTFFGGSGADVSNAVAVDSSGNAYIAGYTASTDLTIAGNTVQGSNGGGWDAFLAIFAPGGSLTFSTYLGGAKTDVAQAVVPLSDGSVVLAGNTQSDNFPLAGFSYDTNYHDGGGDIFVARIVPNVGLNGYAYATFFGGNGYDDVRAMQVLPNGQLLLAGTTGSTDLPLGQAPIQASLKGGTDLFVSVLDLSKAQGAALIYSTYLGGSDVDYLYGLNVKPNGIVLLAGYTFSTDLPVTPSAFQSTLAGPPDAFAMKLDLSKAGAAGLIYSTYAGSARADIGYAVEEDSVKGVLYLAGSTNGKQFPASNPVTRDAVAGDYDLFVLGFPSGSVSLSSAGNRIESAGGQASVLVNAATDSTWQAQSDSSWLTVKEGAAGIGNGAITYAVEPNGSAAERSATLTVAGQKFVVVQSGSTN